MFLPDPLPVPHPFAPAADALNAQLLDVVGGVITELGGAEVDDGPVHAIAFEKVEDPVIMDWYLVARDGRPLARVLAFTTLTPDPITASPTRKVRIRVERYSKGKGDRDGTPSS